MPHPCVLRTSGPVCGCPDSPQANRSNPRVLISQFARNEKAPMEGAFSFLAERVGFEPTVRLHVRLISSQVHSTTLPPLQRGARGPREPASLRGRWARDKLPRGLPVSGAAVSRPFSSPIAARYRPRYPGSATAIRCPVPSATRPDPDGRWGPGRRCRCTCPWRERS